MADGTVRASIRRPKVYDNLLLIVLWSQVVLLAAMGFIVGESLTTVAVVTLALLSIAIAAMVVRSSTISVVAVSVGLVACSIVFVSFSGVEPMAQLYFFVMLAVISLYRDWRPMSVATGLIVAYQLGLGALYPGYEPETALWYSAFTVALALILALSWRIPTEAPPDHDAIDRLRISFDTSSVGMGTLKPSGEFIEANQSLGDLLGRNVDEFPGTNIRHIVHSDDMADVGEAWELIGNDADHAADLWVRAITHQGSSVWTRMSLTLAPLTSDRPAIVVLQLEDMDRAHAEQKRLEHLSRGKDRFVATVGGEIRKHLDRVINLAGEQDLEEIQLRTREAVSIVDNLVSSAKSSSTHEGIVGLPIDVDALCRDTVARVGASERVAVEIDSESLWADPGLTRQILFGLVSNAVRYGGPRVTVEATSSGPDTVVRVTDDGPEVPEPDRERIFSSDLQNGRPATRPAAVGLGLTVGRGLARRMDGDVTYHRSSNGRNIYELRLPSEELRSGYARAGEVDISA